MTDMPLTDTAIAEECFLDGLRDLREGYRDHTFWVERDVVCWMQLRIRGSLPEGFYVFNDYGLLPGPRRSLSADLVISHDTRPLVAIEFKFEPWKARLDIQAKKLPVIGWVDVLKDIGRLEQFVAIGAVEVAWSVCIDEGGRYRPRPAIAIPERRNGPLATGPRSLSPGVRRTLPLNRRQAFGSL